MHLDECPLCAALRRDLLDPQFARADPASLNRIQARLFDARAKRQWPKFAAMAAGLVFVASLLLWRGRPTPATPSPSAIAQKKTPSTYRLAVVAAPLRLPFSTAMVLRGKEEATSQDYLKELGKALDPYRAASYPDAITQLGGLRQRYPKAVEPPFYQGVALLLSSKPDQAIEPLETARAIGGEALNDDIGWYLAAARERIGEWEKAVPLLQTLCRTEGAYRRQACAAVLP
jgi:hypothetical protein